MLKNYFVLNFKGKKKFQTCLLGPQSPLGASRFRVDDDDEEVFSLGFGFLGPKVS